MPNQTKFDLTIENFYSLRPDGAFAKPKATVTLYIDNEKVYFKEFDGALVKGKKDPKIFFKDKNNQEIDNAYITSTENVVLNISSENFDSFGIETRIEANSINWKNYATIIDPLITRPSKEKTTRPVHGFNLEKTSQHIVKGQMFFRPKGNQNEWIAGPSQTKQYVINDDNKTNMKINKFILRKNEELLVTTRFSSVSFPTGSIHELVFRIYDSRIRNRRVIFIQLGDGGRSNIYTKNDQDKAFAVSLFDTTTSEFIGNKNSDGSRAALETGKDYTYKITGWKKTITNTFFQVAQEEKFGGSGTNQESPQIKFMVID